MRRLSFSVGWTNRIEKKRDITVPTVTLIIALAATILMLNHQLAVQPGAIFAGFTDALRGGLDLVIAIIFAVALACAILVPVLLAIRLLVIVRHWTS